MEYASREVLIKNGKMCVIRRAEEADAEMMLEYLRATSGETPYMLREPEEVRTDLEEERELLRRAAEDPRWLMLLAFVDGEFAGSCSFAAVSERSRARHRCTAGISLYRAFWDMGIGTALLEELLEEAEAAGYEQAELDVVSVNERAVRLYKRLGFETVGTVPHAFKYADGSYADFLFMVKKLV